MPEAALPIGWPVPSVLFILGLMVGSFLNVVIYRVPRGLSVVAPRSRCPQCDSAIRSRDNVPILGWLLLQGKCRDCGLAISVRYPLVELSIGLLFVLVGVCGPWKLDVVHFSFAGSQTSFAFVTFAGLLRLQIPQLERKVFMIDFAVPLSSGQGGVLTWFQFGFGQAF